MPERDLDVRRGDPVAERTEMAHGESLAMVAKPPTSGEAGASQALQEVGEPSHGPMIEASASEVVQSHARGGEDPRATRIKRIWRIWRISTAPSLIQIRPIR